MTTASLNRVCLIVRKGIGENPWRVKEEAAGETEGSNLGRGS